ncbi:MAG TPA: copper amine oxidase N-terminal domain-containing protein [Methylomirabilota bacterium]
MREHTKGLKRLMGGLALVTAAAAAALGGVDEGWAARLDAPTSAGPAASLRVGLNALLSEHVYLASAATSAALGGRRPEFEAAAAALDANSVDVAKAIGSVYGPDAEQAFLPLWRTHIGMVVDYTAGAATQDRARQQKAVSDLVGYTQDFGAFLAGASPDLPKAVVAELLQHHVLTLKAVIDAQAAHDQDRAFTALRVGAGHMRSIADPLAGAIARQFPEKFAGAPGAAAGALRTSLNLALREHVYLAAAATNAALGGRDAEFKAAAGALDANSIAVAKAIGSVYGPDAEQAFLPLWRKHIGMVVDYTVGKAAGDRAKQDRAVSDLVAYAQDFGAFLAGANPNLPKAVVADLVKHHVVTLKDVIDAQAAKDPARAFTAQRTGAAHMQMIADPLAEAIVRQFPDRF